MLDNLITMHLYKEYFNEKFSPGFLTTMRSISVNNECYALSAIKAKLHKHILCDSVVRKNIEKTMKGVENLSLESTFGWELETYFCPVSCLKFQFITSSNPNIFHYYSHYFITTCKMLQVCIE